MLEFFKKKLDSYNQKILKSLSGCFILVKYLKLIWLWLSQSRPLKWIGDVDGDPLHRPYAGGLPPQSTLPDERKATT